MAAGGKDDDSNDVQVLEELSIKQRGRERGQRNAEKDRRATEKDRRAMHQLKKAMQRISSGSSQKLDPASESKTQVQCG